MRPAHRIAKNTFILYLKMFFTVVVSLYATRLILAALGASDFGIFNVVWGAIAMLMFLNSAMASASQRFMSFTQGAGNERDLKVVFSISFILHLLIAGFMIILLEGAGIALFKMVLQIPPDRMHAAKVIYQLLIISTFFIIISVPYDAVLNAHENMLIVAVVGIVQVAGRLCIALLISNSPADRLILYGSLMAVLNIVLFGLKLLYCHWKYTESHFRFKYYFQKEQFKKMSDFAGWSLLGSASSMIANYGQGLVLNSFFGTIVNAAQGIANQISGQLSQFASTMLKALNPLIAKSEGAGNRTLMLRASFMGSKLSFFLLLLFYVPVWIEMPYIFDWWLKNVPQYAIIFCRLLLVRNLIEQLFMTIVASIAAVGDIKKYQIYSSILVMTPLIGSYFVFKAGYPPYSIYIIYIIYSLLASAMILYFAIISTGLKLKEFLNQVLARCSMTLVLVFGVSIVPYFLLNEGFLRLLAVGIVSSVAFLLFVWLVGLTAGEKKDVKLYSLQAIEQIKARFLKR